MVWRTSYLLKRKETIGLLLCLLAVLAGTGMIWLQVFNIVEYNGTAPYEGAATISLLSGLILGVVFASNLLKMSKEHAPNNKQPKEIKMTSDSIYPSEYTFHWTSTAQDGAFIEADGVEISIMDLDGDNGGKQYILSVSQVYDTEGEALDRAVALVMGEGRKIQVRHTSDSAPYGRRSKRIDHLTRRHNRQTEDKVDDSRDDQYTEGNI